MTRFAGRLRFRQRHILKLSRKLLRPTTHSFLEILLSYYSITSMACFRSSTPPSLARLFAPSLRCSARRSNLPALRRSFAAPTEQQPRLRLGSVAPNFKAKTTQGDIDFHEWLGNKWGILFSHPADFTPVCTTELGAFAKMKDEFEKRNVKMIGLVGAMKSGS